ncbi:hypothetical protein VTO73DRAFT_5282 [Trametes versicolor]
MSFDETLQKITGKQTPPRRFARITCVHPSGVLIDTTPSGDVHCTRFASPLGIAEQHNWTVTSLRRQPGIPLDIAIDPSQDLLAVLFFNRDARSVFLSLRSLSNGKAHRLASEPSIDIDGGDLFPSYRLLIHGDHILYLHNAFHFYVCGLLCWKKGAFIGECIRNPSIPSDNMAVFLDDARMIFVGYDDKFLHVYDYYTASHFPNGSREAATLEIVPPDTTWLIRTISITTPSLAPNTPFCRPDPRQYIYVIRLVVATDGLENKHIFIFVPRDPIVACAELFRRNKHPRHFGWEEWASECRSSSAVVAFLAPRRILEGDELELEFLDCDIKEVGSLTYRPSTPLGMDASGNAKSNQYAASVRIKTRTTRIHLPVQGFLVRSVAAWENGIIIETLQGSSMFLAYLDGES